MALDVNLHFSEWVIAAGSFWERSYIGTPSLVKSLHRAFTQLASDDRFTELACKTGLGRHHQFAAYEGCRSNCLARCDPASFRFEAYSGRLVRSQVSVWYRRQRSWLAKAQRPQPA